MEFRETRNLIRNLRAELSRIKQSELEQGRENTTARINLSNYQNFDRTVYQVSAEAIREDGKRLYANLDGDAAYPFSTYKGTKSHWFWGDEVVWKYQEPTTWLGKSETVQIFKDRNSAEQKVYQDAKRFAEVLANGLGTIKNPIEILE